MTVASDIHMNVDSSREALLNAIQGAHDITFIRAYGNVGDELIYAGTRQLLRDIDYSEVSIFDLQGVSGHTALLSGSGGWCRPFHEMPKYLTLLEKRFEKVIVLPSSFDVSVPCVREALARTKATVFARELESFAQIKGLCNSQLAFDCAFYFDFRPYLRKGKGVLNAYRVDKEAAGGAIPQGNVDLSVTCESLDEWLWKIARYEHIRTDRAHVTIAAALLGKRVEFRKSNYHKVPAIVNFSLQGYPVSEDRSNPVLSVPSGPGSRSPSEASKVTVASKPSREEEEAWTERLRSTVRQIESLVKPNEQLVLVDEDQLRNLLSQERDVLPFLQRDGEYWGTPRDDAHAIRELEWLREHGARVLVVAWPAFWWLDHYTGWKSYLQKNFRCLAQNETLVAFDLRTADTVVTSAGRNTANLL